jgi:hypothetical protein
MMKKSSMSGKRAGSKPPMNAGTAFRTPMAGKGGIGGAMANAMPGKKKGFMGGGMTSMGYKKGGTVGCKTY